MRPTTCALLIVIACALGSAGSASAQVYRWVDKDGKVHYSDKKPKDAPVKEMPIESQPSDPEAAEKTMAELRAANTDITTTDAERKKVADEMANANADKERRCKSARADLELLKSVNRYFTVDDKGNRVYDNDAQLESRRVVARAKVADLCG